MNDVTLGYNPSELEHNIQQKDGPEDSRHKLFLAHGAGAGIKTDFMSHIAKGVSRHGIQVIRFEFPYMEQMRKTGKRRAPNSAKILIETFRQQIANASGTVFIGGKSMGGRIASMIVEDTKAVGCICLGYPFHPPGKPEKLRTEHLQVTSKPMLIIQGERDPFGTKQEIPNYNIDGKISIRYLPDGEHSFKARKTSGYKTIDNWNQAVAHIVSFIQNFANQEK